MTAMVIGIVQSILTVPANNSSDHFIVDKRLMRREKSDSPANKEFT